VRYAKTFCLENEKGRDFKDLCMGGRMIIKTDLAEIWAPV
jgi:hypothetical protein